jgi:hypothetical protein
LLDVEHSTRRLRSARRSACPNGSRG